MSDAYWGRYLTILRLSFVYCFGIILMSITAIPGVTGMYRVPLQCAQNGCNNRRSAVGMGCYRQFADHRSGYGRYQAVCVGVWRRSVPFRPEERPRTVLFHVLLCHQLGLAHLDDDHTNPAWRRRLLWRGTITIIIIILTLSLSLSYILVNPAIRMNVFRLHLLSLPCS